MKENRKIWIIFLLGSIVAITSLPLIYPYCINNSNMQLYLERIMYADLSDGFLVIPGLLYRILDSAESAYKIYVLLINCMSVAIVFWSLNKIFKTPEIALIGSALYNFAPYRLNSIYIKGDLGEAFAISFIPFTFTILYLIARESEEKYSNIRLSLLLLVAYSCVLQSDILTFLLLLGTTILLLLIFWKKYSWKKMFLVLIQTFIGTLILNFYLISTIGKVLMQTNRTEYFDFSFIQERGVYLLHYIIPYYKYGTDNAFSATGFTNTQPLGVGFAITICVFAYVWILFMKDEKNRNNKILGWGNLLLIVAGINIFLSTNIFPWDYLHKFLSKPLAVIYSPTRFIPTVLTCLTIISCIVLYKLKEEKKEEYRLGLIIVASVSLMLTIYLINDIMTVGEIYASGLYENVLDISPLDYLKYMN